MRDRNLSAAPDEQNIVDSGNLDEVATARAATVAEHRAVIRYFRNLRPAEKLGETLISLLRRATRFG
jgi:hypothetical protein